MAVTDAASALAPRVLLAFDDFSLAGRHLLEQLTIDGAAATPAAAAPLPEALAPHVRVAHFAPEDKQTPTFSVVTVGTAALRDDGAALWTLADALVQWLSAEAVASLRVVAALHLPQAKPHAAPLDNVYAATVDGNGDKEQDTANATSLPALDDAWELTDAFLVRVLHFARVEQAFATQLLVAKGYRPGRDGAGTRDAMHALAAALPLVVKGAAVNVLRAEDDALKAAQTHKKDATQHNLLYQ